jgi:hypothetical protein
MTHRGKFRRHDGADYHDRRAGLDQRSDFAFGDFAAADDYAGAAAYVDKYGQISHWIKIILLQRFWINIIYSSTREVLPRSSD